MDANDFKATVGMDIPPFQAYDEIFSIYDQGNVIVTVKRDGTVEFGEGYEPDKAAKIFWESVVQYMPEHLRQEK